MDLRRSIGHDSIYQKAYHPGELPSLENWGITFEPFEVRIGNLISDVNGNLVQLSEGVNFLGDF